MRLLPAAEIEPARQAWAELERSPHDGGLICGWDWTHTWLRAYGDVVPYRFAVAERGDAVVGAALLTGSRATGAKGFGIRRLHVGTAGEPEGEGVFVEYNGVLTAAGERQAFAEALVAAIEDEPGWDELRVDGFSAEQARALASVAPALELGFAASPYTDLDAIRAGGGDVLAALEKGPRGRIRRGMRGFGELECEWAETESQAGEIFEELVALHQAQWQAAGEGGAFGVVRVLGFHRELIAALIPGARVMLFRVRAGARTVGCLYGLVDGGRLLFYQSGIGAFEDAKLKPGLVTHALCMQACLERGLSAYDFLAGDARYKRELATGEEQLAWGRLSRAGMRPRLAAAARRLARRPQPLTPFG